MVEPLWKEAPIHLQGFLQDFAPIIITTQTTDDEINWEEWLTGYDLFFCINAARIFFSFVELSVLFLDIGNDRWNKNRWNKNDYFILKYARVLHVQLIWPEKKHMDGRM